MATSFSQEVEDLFQRTRERLLNPETSAPPVADSPEKIARQKRDIRAALVLSALFICAGIGFAVTPDGRSAAPFIVGLGITMALMAAVLVLLRRERAAATVGPFSGGTGVPEASPRKSTGRAVAWLVISLLLFAMLAAISYSKLDVACLIGTLLLHEAGHYAGMRYFGYRDVRMFFIPLFGAAVSGQKKDAPAWQQAIVLLLGPLPGLLLGCGIYFADLFVPMPQGRILAHWLVALNFLNLLPLGPLDGGKLCGLVLFQRARLLEAAAVVLGTLGFVFLFFGPGWVCLALSGAFALLVLAPNHYKMATAAMELQSRWDSLPPELAALSDDQWRDLFQSVKARVSDRSLPAFMKLVHARALQRPPSGSVTLRVAAVYLGAFALTLATAAATHLGDDAGRLPVQLRQQLRINAPAK